MNYKEAGCDRRKEHDHVTPTGSFELKRSENQRQLHAEHGIKMQRFHDGCHGRVECGETHVEYDENQQQRNHASISENAAFLAITTRLQLRNGQPVAQCGT